MKSLTVNTGLLGLILTLSSTSWAQYQLGNLKFTGTGNLIGGYNASYGDLVQSNHSFQFGGAAQINGSYYDPKFLSFDLRPYYNQSRANSNLDSIYATSGINASTQIFGGSHFPGTVGFTEATNKRNTFGLANGPELTTNGRGHGFNIAWSELVPGLPTLTAAFSTGTGSGNVLGTNEESSNNSRTFSLRSNYTVAGFRLTGNYQRTSLDAKTPGILLGTQEIDSSGKTDILSFQATHNFPWHGTAFTNVSRTHFENFFEGVSQGRTTADNYEAGVFMIPTKKTTLSFLGSYSDSLYGILNQALASNGVAPLLSLGQGTHSYTMSANGSYAILNGLYAAGTVTHVGQHYWGQDHQNTYFSGTLYGNYRRPLFGILNWSVSVIDNANQEGNTNVGLNAMVNATRRFDRWEVGGDFAYQQNVETLLVGYTISDLHWTSHVSRRADRWFWSAGVGGGHSLLTAVSGDGNHSENVFTTIGNGHYSANFNYSNAAGTSVLTSNGLQSVPIGPIVTPAQVLILYNAHSYGFTGTASPRRSLTIWASYNRATSTTSSTALSSYNYTGLYNANIEYHARRLGFSAGFDHFTQSVGASGIAPANVNSYWVGVNRWFGFF